MEGHLSTIACLSVLVCLQGVDATGTWQDTMVRVCGDAADDLFIGPNDYKGGKLRCRLMRAALQCVETTSRTDVDLLQTWTAMVDYDIVDNMMKNVNDTCLKEGLRLCVMYTIEEDMRQCYIRAGLTPRETFTTDYLSQHCIPMRGAVACMKRRVMLCPDDDHIQPMLHGLDTWLKQLHEACPGMPRLGNTTSLQGNIDDDNDVFSTAFRLSVNVVVIVTASATAAVSSIVFVV